MAMDNLAMDPPVSEAQRKAMFAAKAGNSTLGIPKSVGEEFANADPGGKLPAKAKDESITEDADKLGLEYEKEKGEQTPESKAELSMLNKTGKPVNSEGTLKKVAKDGGPGSGPQKGGGSKSSKPDISNMSPEELRLHLWAKHGKSEPTGPGVMRRPGQQISRAHDGRWGGRAKDCDYAKDAQTNAILDKYEFEKENAYKEQPKNAKNIEKESNLGLGKDGRWGGRKK
jgi:hypothetical protein